MIYDNGKAFSSVVWEPSSHSAGLNPQGFQKNAAVLFLTLMHNNYIQHRIDLYLITQLLTYIFAEATATFLHLWQNPSK